MEVARAIFNRRSVRKYLDKKIEKNILEALLKAAIWAPSSGNTQPWYFIAVNEQNTIKLIKAVSPGLLGIPPALIAVCADKKENVKKMGLGGEILAVMDCSMAAQNIMLRAYDLGFGSCAIRSFSECALRQILKIPEEITPELLITLGYPAKEPSPLPRKEGVIYWESFGVE